MSMTCVLFPLDQSSHTLSEYMHMYSYACKQCTLTGFLLSERQNYQFSQDDNSSHVSENVNKIL